MRFELHLRPVIFGSAMREGVRKRTGTGFIEPHARARLVVEIAAQIRLGGRPVGLGGQAFEIRQPVGPKPRGLRPTTGQSKTCTRACGIRR